MSKYKVYTDGGARGNPGPAACGIVVLDAEEKLIDISSKYIGKATNNIAEYQALLFAFDLLIENKITSDVTFYLDSELVVKQVGGEYKVKDEKLKVYHAKVIVELEKINNSNFMHIPRKQNKHADKLVNIALDLIRND